MFKSKTVFIVGAGASQEVGLPTGAQLKDVIAERLNITYQHNYTIGTPDTGDEQIAHALVAYAHEHQMEGDVNSYIKEAWAIRDAMPQAISIDNYIDAHAMNPRLVLCGKLAIVRSIIEAERNSKLFIAAPETHFDYNRVLNTWYTPFFQILTDGVRRTACESIFDNVSFIIFNYDRCLEHYLYHAIQTYYGIPHSPELFEILRRLVISRPHGLISFLYLNVHSYPFGGYRHRREHETAVGLALVGMANRIRTFTEQIKDHSILARIHQQMQEAETVVFLGFAFHRLNMELLTPDITSNAKRVFATAKGISGADVSVIKKSVIDTLKLDAQRGSGALRISINNKLTCTGLFKEYWHSLSGDV